MPSLRRLTIQPMVCSRLSSSILSVISSRRRVGLAPLALNAFSTGNITHGYITD